MDIMRELRRSRHALTIAGAGVIAFGFWTVLKMTMLMFSDTSEVDEIVAEAIAQVPMEDVEIERIIFLVVFYSVVAILLLLFFLLHLYIGRACIAVGKNEKRRFMYLPLSLFLGILFLVSVRYNILHFTTEFDSAFDGFATTVFDLSSGITMLGIVYSSVRIAVLKWKLRRGQADEH